MSYWLLLELFLFQQVLKLFTYAATCQDQLRRETICGWEEMQVGDRLTDMGQLETSSRHLAPCCANAGSSEERSQFANLIPATISPTHPLIIHPLSEKTRQEGKISSLQNSRMGVKVESLPIGNNCHTYCLYTMMGLKSPLREQRVPFTLI